jgi:hypothetical protein
MAGHGSSPGQMDWDAVSGLWQVAHMAAVGLVDKVAKHGGGRGMGAPPCRPATLEQPRTAEQHHEP